MDKQELLSEVTFGHRVAEEEAEVLERYFVETDHWRRLYRGEIDIIYGPKESGKSALYSLLNSRRDSLFDRGTLLVAAENPRGATAFRGLVADPPTSEHEFTALWKLYFSCLIESMFEDYGFANSAARRLRSTLDEEGLTSPGRNLRSILRAALDYVRKALPVESAGATVEIDQVSGLPTGFGGKITFREPSTADSQRGYISVDSLLQCADEALSETAFNLWILLDRLDVAFAENQELEHNALRALFKVYRDFSSYSHINLKIFLRTDIWKRITKAGFREASHITRHTTITWDRQSLLNLIVSRAMQNSLIQDFCQVSPERVLDRLQTQEDFFYRIFPEQVDVGPNKPRTLEWMIGRTRDGTGMTAPREIIHLLNSLREVQIRKLEIGEAEPEGEQLFARPAFKEAMREVSRARLEQTLYAEYPSLKRYLDDLTGEKTSHSARSLAKIWNCPEEEASATAAELVEVGFFEQKGTKEDPEYWVPFLYRDALELVQGSAD